MGATSQNVPRTSAELLCSSWLATVLGFGRVHKAPGAAWMFHVKQWAGPVDVRSWESLRLGSQACWSNPVPGWISGRIRFHLGLKDSRLHCARRAGSSLRRKSCGRSLWHRRLEPKRPVVRFYRRRRVYLSPILHPVLSI